MINYNLNYKNQNMDKKHNDTGEAKKGSTNPIKTKEQVQQSKDEKIDQDFPGFPHHPSTEEEVKNKKTSPGK